MVTFDGCTPMLIIPTIKNKLTNALEIMRSGDISDDGGGGGGGLTFDGCDNDDGFKIKMTFVIMTRIRMIREEMKMIII